MIGNAVRRLPTAVCRNPGRLLRRRRDAAVPGSSGRGGLRPHLRGRRRAVHARRAARRADDDLDRDPAGEAGRPLRRRARRARVLARLPRPGAAAARRRAPLGRGVRAPGAALPGSGGLGRLSRTSCRPSRRWPRAGLPLAVVSNWDSYLPRLLELRGLSPVLPDGVGVGASRRRESPTPRSSAGPARAWRSRRREALHVGDSLRDDFEGARAAGLHALLLDRRDQHGDVAERIAQPGGAAGPHRLAPCGPGL